MLLILGYREIIVIIYTSVSYQYLIYKVLLIKADK